MSRQRPDLVQTPDQTAGQTVIPIAEAAARLGISVDAVRKRIARGKLTGHKTDQGWTVVWTELDIRPESVQTGVQDRSVLIARLESENAYLRATLDAEIEARRRADHLVAGLTDRLPELAATVEGAATKQMQAHQSGVAPAEPPERPS